MGFTANLIKPGHSISDGSIEAAVALVEVLMRLKAGINQSVNSFHSLRCSSSGSPI
jgi:hypothetical protein